MGAGGGWGAGVGAGVGAGGGPDILEVGAVKALSPAGAMIVKVERRYHLKGLWRRITSTMCDPFFYFGWMVTPPEDISNGKKPED